MMPAMMRPLALKIASSATNQNPALMVLFDCTATMRARWAMTMRPAVAAQAYWIQSMYNIGDRTMSRHVFSGFAAAAGAPSAFFTATAGFSGFLMNWANRVAATRNAMPRIRKELAMPYVAMRFFESGAM